MLRNDRNKKPPSSEKALNPVAEGIIEKAGDLRYIDALCVTGISVLCAFAGIPAIDGTGRCPGRDPPTICAHPDIVGNLDRELIAISDILESIGEQQVHLLDLRG